MAPPRDDLIAALRERPEDVLAIIGSGVSVATSGGHTCASWLGLLRSGIEFCRQRAGQDERWERLRHDQLAAQEFIPVADMICDALRAPRHGIFAEWLLRCFENFPVKDRRIVEALRDMGCQLATTNYDTSTEKITGWRSCTWRDRHLFSQLLGPA
jgi:hypothetical protein